MSYSKQKSSGPEVGKFVIPDSFFDKFYELTGSDESSRGFICAYISNDNCPMIYTCPSNPMVEMALVKVLEEYIKNRGGSLEENPDKEDNK